VNDKVAVAQPENTKSKIEEEKQVARNGSSCCRTCEGFGGLGRPSAEYLAQAERRVKMEVPPIWIEWREVRTEAREAGEVSDEIVQDPSWWYAQVCLGCLKAVQHRNLHMHLMGALHRKAVTKLNLRTNYKRMIPILVSPYNHASNAMEVSTWGEERMTPLQVLPKEQLLENVAELRQGQRCLILGEQDFSFSNMLALVVGGKHVIGTCYLSSHDPSVPDVKTMDDGERRFHQQKTLGSMDGDLAANLALSEQNGVRIRYNVDAQDIEASLLDQEPEEIIPFNRIIFPFPRVSLVRGCDPNNSILVKKFLTSAIKPRCLAKNGLVQLIMLENQFTEWDILHIAEEVGLCLRAIGFMNFTSLPYQARDVTGKRIRSAAMHDKTLYISFARVSTSVVSNL